MWGERRSAALAGVAAVAAALGVGELVAILTGPLTSPAIAVGGAIIDNVPESLKHFAITLFGTHDKLALQVGMLVLPASSCWFRVNPRSRVRDGMHPGFGIPRSANEFRVSCKSRYFCALGVPSTMAPGSL